MADTPGYQYYGGDRYVATRSGWAGRIRLDRPARPDDHRRRAEVGDPAAFTPDLGGWAQIVSTQAQFPVGVAQLYTGGLDGSFDPLSPLLAPIDDSGS